MNNIFDNILVKAKKGVNTIKNKFKNNSTNEEEKQSNSNLTKKEVRSMLRRVGYDTTKLTVTEMTQVYDWFEED